MELRYICDTDKREVAFVVIKDKKPLFAVECKIKERSVSPHVIYFSERVKIPRFYQVHLEEADYETAEQAIRVLPFHTLVRELRLPKN